MRSMCIRIGSFKIVPFETPFILLIHVFKKSTLNSNLKMETTWEEFGSYWITLITTEIGRLQMTSTFLEKERSSLKLLHLITLCTKKQICVTLFELTANWLAKCAFFKGKKVSASVFCWLRETFLQKLEYEFDFIGHLLSLFFSVFSDTANEFSKSHFSPERNKINGSGRVNETNTNKSQITLRFELFASKLFKTQ